MTKRRKAIVIALSVLALVLVALVAVNRYVSDSFTLVVYKEGQPIEDSSLEVPDNARLTKVYSPRGHYRDFDNRGNLAGSDFVFWLPVTVSAEKDINEVVYRSLYDDFAISLPHGSKSSELLASGKDATGYMQVWFYIATHEESDGFYDVIPNIDVASISGLQNPCFEVEVRYQDGMVSKKRYSLFPGEKEDAYDIYTCDLESLIIAEEPE